MTYLIFIGDMLVMAFMMGIAVWFFYRSNDEQIDEVSRIPLDDEEA